MGQTVSLQTTIRDNSIIRKLFYPSVLFLRRLRRFNYPSPPTADAGPLIAEAILERRPLAVGKLGASELLGLTHFLLREKRRAHGLSVPPYSHHIGEGLAVNSGVFPWSHEAFDCFCKSWLAAIPAMDVMAVWFNRGESDILLKQCPDAARVTLESLEPYLSQEPWSAALAGKRVLAVHPFAASIRSQHTRRTELWGDPRVLPDFTLSTVQAPLSAGLVAPQHPDWHTACEALMAEMDSHDYDVVIIGAGAFSLPLAVHAKQRGKVGIHLGGATQLLWGIVGGRWSESVVHRRFFRSSWVRPGRGETPPDARRVERGAYW